MYEQCNTTRVNIIPRTAECIHHRPTRTQAQTTCGHEPGTGQTRIRRMVSLRGHLHFLQRFRRDCSERWEHDSVHLVGREDERERGPVDLLPEWSHPVPYHKHGNYAGAHHLAQQNTIVYRNMTVVMTRELRRAYF